MNNISKTTDSVINFT